MDKRGIILINLQHTDTIAAQATPPGEGGIAIVRVSGPACREILSLVFRARAGKPLAARQLTYGQLLDGEEVLDEAMAVLMPAPHSYTREDVAELHCHGSQALVAHVLGLLLRSGARMAEPGEFTLRAFLNGRVDLAQAEAVMRMIRAGSERAMRSANRQMEGGVSAFVKEARAYITEVLAGLSAAVDFPDEIEESAAAEQVSKQCRAICTRLREACDPRAGRIEDEGLRVVLAGRPNAGKSTLLNALVGGERAIVTDVPGTTRDTLTESITIDGIRVVLTDTAGLRETSDPVERIGVARARQAIEQADVLALVLDASEYRPEQDAEVLGGLLPQLVILTKGDLAPCVDEEQIRSFFPGVPTVMVCAQTGEGMDSLRRVLIGFAPSEAEESGALTQARHVQAALRACDSLDDAVRAIAEGYPLDMAAIDLASALEALGEITGETMRESVIEEVFSRFCVGK